MEYQSVVAGNSTSNLLDWGNPSTGNKEHLPHELLVLLGGAGSLCSLCSVQIRSVEPYPDAFKPNMLPNQSQQGDSENVKCES